MTISVHTCTPPHPMRIWCILWRTVPPQLESPCRAELLMMRLLWKTLILWFLCEWRYMLTSLLVQVVEVYHPLDSGQEASWFPGWIWRDWRRRCNEKGTTTSLLAAHRVSSLWIVMYAHIDLTDILLIFYNHNLSCSHLSVGICFEIPWGPWGERLCSFVYHEVNMWQLHTMGLTYSYA